MKYYQEIKRNYFELRSLDENIELRDGLINEIKCNILGEEVIFAHDAWCKFRNYPIRRLDGSIVHERYHACSNSIIGETLILLLEALGYKCVSLIGSDIEIDEYISVPIHRLSSTVSLYVKIDKNEDNLRKIMHLKRFGNDDCFFDVYSSESIWSNYIEPFMSGKTSPPL